MLFIICVNKLHKLFFNFNHMGCLFQEQNKEKFIKEPLEDNLKKEEKSKLIELVQLLIGLVMPCYILYLDVHLLTIVLSLLNILLLI